MSSCCCSEEAEILSWTTVCHQRAVLTHPGYHLCSHVTAVVTRCRCAQQWLPVTVVSSTNPPPLLSFYSLQMWLIDPALIYLLNSLRGIPAVNVCFQSQTLIFCQIRALTHKTGLTGHKPPSVESFISSTSYWSSNFLLIVPPLNVFFCFFSPVSRH